MVDGVSERLEKKEEPQLGYRKIKFFYKFAPLETSSYRKVGLW